MTNGIFANEMLVCIVITFREVSYKRRMYAKNNHNMNINENMTYQNNVSGMKWSLSLENKMLVYPG